MVNEGEADGVEVNVVLDEGQAGEVEMTKMLSGGEEYGLEVAEERVKSKIVVAKMLIEGKAGRWR